MVKPNENSVSVAPRALQTPVAPAAAPPSIYPVGHKDPVNIGPSQLPFSEGVAVANGTQSDAVLNSLVDDFTRASLTGGPETG